eukprot:scaffold13037_cov57-Cyclotella_meneghiniana.AAC.5
MKEGGRSLHFFRKLATRPCSLGDSMADVGAGGVGSWELGEVWRVRVAVAVACARFTSGASLRYSQRVPAKSVQLSCPRLS